MSGRCRACDAIMEEWEMKAIDPTTGTYTELCDQCIQLAENPDYESEWDSISLDSISTEELL